MFKRRQMLSLLNKASCFRQTLNEVKLLTVQHYILHSPPSLPSPNLHFAPTSGGILSKAHCEHVQHCASLCSVDWVRNQDSVKVIADYDGPPSISKETKVLCPLHAPWSFELQTCPPTGLEAKGCSGWHSFILEQEKNFRMSKNFRMPWGVTSKICPSGCRWMVWR